MHQARGAKRHDAPGEGHQKLNNWGKKQSFTTQIPLVAMKINAEAKMP